MPAPFGIVLDEAEVKAELDLILRYLVPATHLIPGGMPLEKAELFVKGLVDNDELRKAAVELWNSIDWPPAS